MSEQLPPAPATFRADLAAAFDDLGRRLGVQGAGWDSLGEQLLDAYDEPHRRYHTLEHLAEVLDTLDRLLLGEPDAEREILQLAAWFHDAVYDPAAPDNERRSAQWADAALATCGIDERRRRQVVALVLATAGHDLDEDDAVPGAACFLDADLAILGARPARYRRYARAIREEYGHLSDEAFRAGRRAVLMSLLSRPALYRTPAGVERFALIAQANLAGELGPLL